MSEEVHELPAGSTLDLHHFRPHEVEELIEEFIWSCVQASVEQGTIIHGKGTGSLRELTHSILRKNPKVKGFQLGDGTNPGNWGKTSFELLCSDA
ncbi:MAG: Smr/MutS family protein [Opitutae bacterium]